MINLLTPKEAAEILDVSNRYVLTLCKDGRLGFKVGGRYLIEPDDLDRFIANRRPRGNPNFINKSEVNNG